MKSAKIIFWTTTGLLFLTQGLMPILTSHMPESKEAMSHLGYPAYFPLMLAIFKLFGGLSLIIPQIPAKVKEWAYAGFGIDFIAAFVSIAAVGGLGTDLLFPTIAMAILTASYLSYHKITTK
jgi:uncharacterized membrane protein YphA (DoxX/SURF4 family)